MGLALFCSQKRNHRRISHLTSIHLSRLTLKLNIRLFPAQLHMATLQVGQATRIILRQVHGVAHPEVTLVQQVDGRAHIIRLAQGLPPTLQGTPLDLFAAQQGQLLRKMQHTRKLLGSGLLGMARVIAVLPAALGISTDCLDGRRALGVVAHLRVMPRHGQPPEPLIILDHTTLVIHIPPTMLGSVFLSAYALRNPGAHFLLHNFFHSAVSILTSYRAPQICHYI